MSIFRKCRGQKNKKKNQEKEEETKRQKGALDKFLTLSFSVEEEEICASTRVPGNEIGIGETGEISEHQNCDIP